VKYSNLPAGVPPCVPIFSRMGQTIVRSETGGRLAEVLDEAAKAALAQLLVDHAHPEKVFNFAQTGVRCFPMLCTVVVL
jgi:hypothetical protein